MELYNIYCDESCHLENDGKTAMALGAVWCPTEKVKQISKEIRDIKASHKLKQGFEIKWTKVNDKKSSFYLDIVNYFFQNEDLHFRVVVADKTELDHDDFSQTHDEWYYKMYFLLIQYIIKPRSSRYRVYIDIKDTKGGSKVKKLHEFLSNANYDFSREIIERMQIVKSHESEILQISDLFIGAMSYWMRGETEKGNANQGKVKLINSIKEQSGYSLTKSTLPSEQKFNFFIWHPRRHNNV